MIVAVIVIALFVFTCFWCKLHQHTFNRSRVKRLFPRHRLPK